MPVLRAPYFSIMKLNGELQELGCVVRGKWRAFVFSARSYMPSYERNSMISGRRNAKELRMLFCNVCPVCGGTRGSL
jgi:hypothetical protein